MNGFLKISGDYTRWNVYRKSVIICDVTEMFINRAIEAKFIENGGLKEAMSRERRKARGY